MSRTFRAAKAPYKKKRNRKPDLTVSDLYKLWDECQGRKTPWELYQQLIRRLTLARND